MVATCGQTTFVNTCVFHLGPTYVHNMGRRIIAKTHIQGPKACVLNRGLRVIIKISILWCLYTSNSVVHDMHWSPLRDVLFQTFPQGSTGSQIHLTSTKLCHMWSISTDHRHVLATAPSNMCEVSV